eukprot:PhF_6_TR35201/c0_g1_i2/m.51260
MPPKPQAGDCMSKDTCWNRYCTRNHSSKRTLCPNKDCGTPGCGLIHPPYCRENVACTTRNCQYRHPPKHLLPTVTLLKAPTQSSLPAKSFVEALRAQEHGVGTAKAPPQSSLQPFTFVEALRAQQHGVGLAKAPPQSSLQPFTFVEALRAQEHGVGTAKAPPQSSLQPFQPVTVVEAPTAQQNGVRYITHWPCPWCQKQGDDSSHQTKRCGNLSCTD